MFTHALDQLGVTSSEYPRCIMVGNRLDRDVKGANDLGLISVWLNWSPRGRKSPEDRSEEPRFTIHTPLELLEVLGEVEGSWDSSNRGRLE